MEYDNFRTCSEWTAITHSFFCVICRLLHKSGGCSSSRDKTNFKKNGEQMQYDSSKETGCKIQSMPLATYSIVHIQQNKLK